MISLKLAVRNLLRNRWRSALTLGGVAVAVGLMVWTLAFYEGWIAEMVRGATSVETGQVQIQTAAYAEDGRIYQSFPVDEVMLDAVGGVAGVTAVTPRVVAHGIVGNEQRSRVARIVGVDPAREAEVSPVADAVEEGRWLSDAPAPEGFPREVVLGADLARQLRVDPGDELVVFLEASDGSLGNDLLKVAGTVRTGNSGLDGSAAFLHLEDARLIAALEGEASALVVRTEDPSAAREVAWVMGGALRGVVERAVRVRMPPEDVADAGAGAAVPETGSGPADATAGEADTATADASGAAQEAISTLDPDEVLVVRPWQDIAPAMNEMIVLVRRSYWILYLFIYFVAALGILNTQRMSALERRREFGVMMAIGLRPRRMFRILQVETVTLGFVGTLLGALLGGALAWYHATAGFDMSGLTSQASFTYMGVAFSERIHFVLTTAGFVQPLLVMLGVSLLSGLWPAITAARIEPAPTIAGRRQ